MSGRAVVGRAAELDVVDAFLASLDDGPARLLVEGEPGIGKTTVWQAASSRARERGYRILTSRPGPSETRLTFAGLGDFLSGVDDDALEALPAPQRRALRVALLRDDPDGPAPEQREVSTAFLGMLRALAAETSVLVAVDDLQWLDRPSRRVLEFAVRRLESERVGVLAAARPGGDWARELVALQATRIVLPPLSLASLHEVLKAELTVTFPRPTLVRIEAVSSGNPFFAIELARALVEHGEPVHGSAPLPVPDDLTELIAVAGGDRFIALAPSSIRTAVKHEIEWFKRIKANHYSTRTPLGSWTVAEVRQITNFERTQCGITFS
jgi:DNA polymerase III delta prime subunit